MRKVLCVIMLALWSSLCLGQEEDVRYELPTKPEDYVVSSGVHFYDDIDPTSGAMNIKHRDLVIPGPGGLNIEITRTYNSPSTQYPYDNPNIIRNFRHKAFGESWHLNFGYIYREYWNRKSSVAHFMSGKSVSNNLDDCQLDSPADHYSPLFRTPDGSINRVYSSDTTYSYHTLNGWRGGCLPPVNNLGDNGFVFYAPNGHKYIYNILRKVSEVKPEAIPSTIGANEVYRYAYFASRIEDKYGNWINISYVDGAERADIDQITSGDGRVVTFNYTNRGSKDARISSINTASGSTVNYYFENSSTDNITRVEKDGKTIWKFEYYLIHEFPYEGTYSSFPNSLKSIENAIGGRIEYKYDTAINKGIHRMWERKQLGTPVESTKTYSYYQVSGGRVTVYYYTLVKELGRCVKYLYERFERPIIDDRHWAQGLMQSEEIFNNSQCEGTPVQSTEYEWAGQYFSSQGRDTTGYYDGFSGLVISNDEHVLLPSLTKKTVRRDGDIYVTDFSDFTLYGNPQKIVSYAPSGSTSIEWKDFTLPDNLKGLERLVSASRSSTDEGPKYEYQKYVYNSNLDVEKDIRFGVEKTFEYYANGDLKEVKYTGSNRYELYENYYRGQPQTIKQPSRYLNGVNNISSQEINADGTLKSRTNEKGVKTSFSYDALDRLTLIDPQDSSWSDTEIIYRTAGEGDPQHVTGLSVRELERGNFQRTTYVDGLNRPILERERDLSDIASTTRYVNFAYNAEGLQSFRSYLSNDPMESEGFSYEYDVLDRIVEVKETVTGNKTTFDYLPQNKTRVTDSKGHITTTTYLAYGEPANKLAVKIEAPEAVTTTIEYTLFDSIDHVTQGEYTSDYVYDANQRLCKYSRPETGWQFFEYTVSGKIAWSANGISSDTSTCDRATVTAAKKRVNTYDNQDDLWMTTFGDGTPAITRELDSVGNLTGLDFGNQIWDYTYNSINLVETQTLTVDEQAFALGTTYNSLGHVNSLTYPSGREVSYHLNALGQVKSVGDYVTNATYHTSGTLDTITYGNGMTYSTSLNARQLPSDMYVNNADDDRLSDLVFGWDKNANITLIQDLVNPQYTIDMDYDGLNRLTQADGYWGNGSITYDTAGNIRTKNLGSQVLTYHYDTRNRLNSVSGSKPYTFNYDLRGNVTDNGHRAFTFNALNQLTHSEGINFEYDGHGKRVTKNINGEVTYSIYGLDGTLYYRQKPNGDHIDYLYLNNRLVTTAESR